MFTHANKKKHPKHNKTFLMGKQKKKNDYPCE